MDGRNTSDTGLHAEACSLLRFAFGLGPGATLLHQRDVRQLSRVLSSRCPVVALPDTIVVHVSL